MGQGDDREVDRMDDVARAELVDALRTSLYGPNPKGV